MTKKHYAYKTDFKLSAPISSDNFETSFNYLVEDNMVDYIDEDEIRESLISIRYVLSKLDKGIIFIIARRELTEQELEIIKQNLEDQNSDGLGEGFSSQDFAEYITDNGEHECIYIETEVPTLTIL